MADVTVERSAELTKEVALLKSRNKTLGNIVDVDKDILIKSKEQATAMGELGDNVKSIGNNLLSGAENLTTSIFGGALGGVLNSLTIGMVKRKNENSKIEKEKAKEVAKATAEEKAINDKRMSVLVETLALSEEVAEDGRKFADLKNEEILEIIKNTELEKEKRERNEKIKEEEQKAIDFIKKENKAKENGGATVSSESDTSGEFIVISDFIKAGMGNQSDNLEKIVASTEKTSVATTKSQKNEETPEDRREKLRNEREAKGLGGQVTKIKLDSDADAEGFSLKDIFTKGGRGKLITSLGGTLLGGATTAIGPGSDLATNLGKKASWGQLSKGVGFGLIAAGIASIAVGGIQGLAKSKEWGTGDATAALGGMLGGIDDGAMGAVTQAGKFAVIGAGIGSVFPVIGTVIGGVIGGLLGAFLGFFGGEKIAKAIEKMNSFLGDRWKSIKVAMGIDTFSDDEIADNIEKEKKELDNEIKAKTEQIQKTIADRKKMGYETTDETAGFQKEALKLLQSERLKLDAPETLTERTAESAQTRKANAATIKASGGEDRGGTNILTKGFFGVKFLFNAFPALRGVLDPELAKDVYNPNDTFLGQLASIFGFDTDDPVEGVAKGGFIVNKPTYLPNSGVVVGEHGTYRGGAAYGGIADGGPEAVIPLSSTRAGAFIDPMARSVAGAVLNQLAMSRVGMSGGAGGSGASVVTGNDMSSNQVSNNTTVINNPSPIGQTLPDEGRDFVSKVA